MNTCLITVTLIGTGNKTVNKTATKSKDLCFYVRKSNVNKRITQINTNFQEMIERSDIIMEVKKGLSKKVFKNL